MRYLTFHLFFLSMAATLKAFAALPAELTCDDRFIVSPLIIDDPRQSEALSSRVLERMQQRYALECLKNNAVSAKNARIAFEQLGISAQDIASNEVKAFKLERLVKKTKANFLVGVEWEAAASVLRINVYKIAEQQLRTIDEFSITLNPEEVAKLPISSQVVRKLSFFMPNSIVWGALNTSLNLEIEDEYKYTRTIQHHAKLPDFISALSFSHVEHYDRFRLFDIDGSMSLGSYLFAIDQTERIHLIEDGFDSSRDHIAQLKLYGFCTNGNLIGSIHWPLGTLFAGIGLGPCGFYQRHDDGPGALKANLAFRMLFGHRSFFAERWFYTFGADILIFVSRMYQSSFATASSVNRASLGIGYYLPDAHHRTIKLSDSYLD